MQLDGVEVERNWASKWAERQRRGTRDEGERWRERQARGEAARPENRLLERPKGKSARHRALPEAPLCSPVPCASGTTCGLRSSLHPLSDLTLAWP